MLSDFKHLGFASSVIIFFVWVFYEYLKSRDPLSENQLNTLDDIQNELDMISAGWPVPEERRLALLRERDYLINLLKGAK